MIDPRTTNQPAGKRVALAHDWLCGYRGGEAVLERVAVLCERAGGVDRLYTMFDDGRPLAPHVDALERVASPLNALPGRARRWLLPLYPFAVGRLSARLASDHRRRPVDLLVSTSSAAIKGMRAPEGVPHLCYCHAPARYVWTIGDEYARGGGLVAAARRAGLGLFGASFRRWDRRTAAHVTRFIANSAYTASRIEACFGRESVVVHPPVRTGFFTPDPDVERGGTWLLVGALEPYKRVDLAVRAAALAGARLLVVGSGSMEAQLRAMPGDAEFLGRVGDDELRDLYRRARLLLYPQIEDFGISAVEAQACGCPVVARRAGGALDSVVDGVTGCFFEGDSPGAVAEAAQGCPPAGGACVENAGRFSEAAFDALMGREIGAMLGG